MNNLPMVIWLLGWFPVTDYVFDLERVVIRVVVILAWVIVAAMLWDSPTKPKNLKEKQDA